MVKVVRKKAKKPQPIAAEKTYTITEIPGLPRREGPPSVPNGQGRATYEGKRGAQPFFAPTTKIGIDLDPGALWWLWETAEHQALEHYRRYRGVSPALIDAAKRAVEELRRAGHHVYPPMEQPKKVKVVRRKKAGKKVIRRK